MPKDKFCLRAQTNVYAPEGKFTAQTQVTGDPTNLSTRFSLFGDSPGVLSLKATRLAQPQQLLLVGHGNRRCLFCGSCLPSRDGKGREEAAAVR